MQCRDMCCPLTSLVMPRGAALELVEGHSVLGGIMAGLTKLHVHVCGADARTGVEQQNQPQLHVALSLCWARAASSPAGKSPVLARAAEV